METPYVSNQDAGSYYTHYLFSENNESESLGRNYSFNWSASDHLALWVAYPLYGDLLEKNVDRTNAFAQDPKFTSLQQASKNGYTGTDSYTYTRGHQLPSADRLSSDALNRTTFYMTNMTPQLDDFNNGVWNSLEQKVTTWANASDEFYVVTGCFFENRNKTVTSNGYTIPVPTHYYKALLRKKNNSWSACAYIYGHFTASSFKESDRISIDALEQQTGVDFFPNLVGLVGQTTATQIESTATAF